MNFDGILQETQQAFLFLGQNRWDQHALVTAQRTEIQRLAALEAEDMHAFVTHHLIAMGTPVSSLGS